ncbi:MAG: BrnA antitoxin family protein [Gammaproteobacteria bacterium]|nr:BrnA antitoxin family protein [Gammaproteobacteria bacterium]
MKKPKKPNPELISDDAPELDSEWFKHAGPAEKVLPSELLAVLPKRRPGQRGPQKKAPKVSVNLRLSPEVVDRFRSSGPGWQKRVDEALKEWLDAQPALIQRHTTSALR